MAFRVEEKILWLDITVSDSLAMKIGDAVQDLLEAALDFAWTHPTVGRAQSTIRSKQDETREKIIQLARYGYDGEDHLILHTNAELKK